jgi:hypothetical protein
LNDQSIKNHAIGSIVDTEWRRRQRASKLRANLPSLRELHVKRFDMKRLEAEGCEFER